MYFILGIDSNLVCDIWSGITDIAVHLAHHTNVLVAVEERVFLVALTWSTPSMTGLVCLKTGIGEDDDEALGVFIGLWNWHMLLGDELGEGGRWERLSA